MAEHSVRLSTAGGMTLLEITGVDTTVRQAVRVTGVSKVRG
jgi:hypothetical protein